MATKVEHPNETIQQLALDYIADLEEVVAYRFGKYVNEVDVHNAQISDVQAVKTRKRRWTTTPKKR